MQGIGIKITTRQTTCGKVRFDRVRKNYRRWNAGRGSGDVGEIIEHIALLGSVYQAGTLSGNPVAVAAVAVRGMLCFAGTRCGGFRTDTGSCRASIFKIKPSVNRHV